MSAGWPSQNAANYLTYPPGDFLGNGAYTMAFLVDPGGNMARFGSFFQGGANKGSLLIDTGDIYGHDDFSPTGVDVNWSGTTPWTVVAITKATGSSTYRIHYWTYASDGSGTMTHTVAASAGTHANESGADQIRIGFAEATSMWGDLAIAAYWDRDLSDADLEALKTNQIDDWKTMAPKFGVHYGSWNGSIGSDVIFSGSSGAGTEVGTVAVGGSNPTSFNFTLTTPDSNEKWLEAINALQPYAFWRLGDIGGTMADWTNNHRDGTHTGVTKKAAGSVASDIDYACTYAGASTSVSDFAYQAWMNPGNDKVSFIAAVKFTATGGPFMFFSRTGSTGYNQGLYVDTKKIAFGVNTGSGSLSAVGTSDKNDGAWHLAIGTYSPANGIRIYVDGTLETTTALNGTINTAARDMQIGGRGANYFTGSVDEAVPLPGIELTQAQITYLYQAWNNTLPTPTSVATMLEQGGGALELEQGGGVLMTEGV